MKGIGVLIVLGAGLAALAAASAAKAEEKKPEAPKPPEGPRPIDFGPEIEPPVAPPVRAPSAFELCVDANMPSALRLEAEKAFAAKNLMPADYEKMAAVYAEAGYPVMAKCLADIGKEKLAAKKAEIARRGGMPHTIRMGDIPSLMAMYYTGDAMRFKELGPLNPQIGQLKTVNKVTNYTKWIPGTEILIPASWNPLDKPIPPPASGGKAPTDATLEQERKEAETLLASMQKATEGNVNPATGQPFFT